MTGRFWFYLGSSIVIAGLFSWHVATQNKIRNEQSGLDQEGRTRQIESLTKYGQKQTDGHKLVSLAKLISYENRELLRVIIERAYELNPQSRDITLLASEFKPELKEKVRELDPLYDQ